MLLFFALNNPEGEAPEEIPADYRMLRGLGMTIALVMRIF